MALKLLTIPQSGTALFDAPWFIQGPAGYRFY